MASSESLVTFASFLAVSFLIFGGFVCALLADEKIPEDRKMLRHVLIGGFVFGCVTGLLFWFVSTFLFPLQLPHISHGLTGEQKGLFSH